jgi:hypothetical protein
MKNDEAARVPVQLWHLFSERRWDEAKELLADGFEAWWPQSREKMTRDNFIEVNRTYPGTHKIEVQDVRLEYERWDHTTKVTTVVHIKSKMPDGKDVELYATSFFDVDRNNLITEVTEYWADTYDAPEWRKHLVERF